MHQLLIVLIVIVFIYSVAKSYKGMKNLKNVKRVKVAKLLLGFGTLATLFCPILAYLGATYIENYQSINSRCPSNYPYAWLIVLTAAVGITSFVSGGVLVWLGRQRKISFMIFLSALILGVIATGAYFLSVFCLTF